MLHYSGGTLILEGCMITGSGKAGLLLCGFYEVAEHQKCRRNGHRKRNTILVHWPWSDGPIFLVK